MAEKYFLDGDKKKPIICQDLTYGFLLGVEDGTIEDNKQNVVENGTGLDMEMILSLRRHQIEEIYAIIIRLTYPELYNEDGTPKEIEDEKPSKGKKKV